MSSQSCKFQPISTVASEQIIHQYICNIDSRNMHLKHSKIHFEANEGKKDKFWVLRENDVIVEKLCVSIGGRADGWGFWGLTVTQATGGWVDRLTQATVPRGPSLIGTDHKVLTRFHLMWDCKQGQRDVGLQLPVAGQFVNQQGTSEATGKSQRWERDINTILHTLHICWGANCKTLIWNRGTVTAGYTSAAAIGQAEWKHLSPTMNQDFIYFLEKATR